MHSTLAEFRLSFFGRVISNPDRHWLVLGIAILFWLLPFVGAAVAEAPAELLLATRWRGLFVAPTVIVYIIVVSPMVDRLGREGFEALRAVVLVDDEAYADLIRRGGTLSLRNELAAFGIGAVLGILRVNFASVFSSWMDLYLMVSNGLMFGLLAWAIYASIAGSRVMRLIFQQPLQVDPTELTAFEPIGRQSLMLSLVFVGGTVLSMVFSALDPQVFGQLSFWLIYVPIALAPIAFFFLSMLPTHRVLAAAKASELQSVRIGIRQASLQLREGIAQGKETVTTAQEIRALAVLEQRLQSARTWPYNTTMLRTLFISVLIPGTLLLIRTLFERFWPS